MVTISDQRQISEIESRLTSIMEDEIPMLLDQLNKLKVQISQLLESICPKNPELKN